MPRSEIIPFRRLTATCLVGLALALSPGPGHAGKEPKKRVAVTDFENRAGYNQWNNLGRGMAEKLIEALIATGKFVVLERIALSDVVAEQNLDRLAPVRPDQEARLTKAQALIRGVVTDIQDTGGDRGGVTLRGVRIGGKKRQITVKVNIRIIDTVTGQVIESQTTEGIAREKGLKILGRTKKGKGVDYEGERKLPVGEAADLAVVNAVEGIIDGMERIPWQGRIARVSGRQIFVNAGLRENVEPGLRLRVFEQGTELIDPRTNESLGSLDEEIGIIEIEKVESGFSLAKIIQGQGFASDNIVRPADDLQ